MFQEEVEKEEELPKDHFKRLRFHKPQFLRQQFRYFKLGFFK